MNLFINGQSLSLTDNNTLEHALNAFLTEQQQQLSFAVALNGDFVGKADYLTTDVSNGDSIDILFPIQGG